jgi:hypothetical protein
LSTAAGFRGDSVVTERSSRSRKRCTSRKRRGILVPSAERPRHVKASCRVQERLTHSGSTG